MQEVWILIFPTIKDAKSSKLYKYDSIGEIKGGSKDNANMANVIRECNSYYTHHEVRSVRCSASM